MSKAKPTDKKLTFVEWLAGREGVSVKKAKEGLQIHTDILINDGIHREDCTETRRQCWLCALQHWLSEYREYFKQK